MCGAKHKIIIIIINLYLRFHGNVNAGASTLPIVVDCYTDVVTYPWCHYYLCDLREWVCRNQKHRWISFVYSKMANVQLLAWNSMRLETVHGSESLMLSFFRIKRERKGARVKMEQKENAKRQIGIEKQRERKFSAYYRLLWYMMALSVWQIWASFSFWCDTWQKVQRKTFIIRQYLHPRKMNAPHKQQFSSVRASYTPLSLCVRWICRKVDDTHTHTPICRSRIYIYINVMHEWTMKHKL